MKKVDWLDHKDLYNVHLTFLRLLDKWLRALGLALASKKYRESKVLKNTQFSNKGNEISWVTIGDASTSEGIFWETINAAGVQKLPSGSLCLG